jgi:hypothetical protein
MPLHRQGVAVKSRCISIPAIIALAAFAVPAQSRHETSSVKLLIVSGKPVVDQIYLDGHGPYRFLLDLGSQTNQLEPELARKVGLLWKPEVVLYTPSGPSAVQAGEIGKVRLGGLETFNQEFLIAHCGDLTNLAAPIQGILGQEFLSHFDYLLDLKNKRLTVEDAPTTGTRISIHLIYGRMALPTSVGNLVLDSGAEMLFLFKESDQPKNTRLMSATGVTTAISVTAAPAIMIAGRVYHPERVAFQSVAGAEEAGLLPINLFHSVFISNSQKFVVLDP